MTTSANWQTFFDNHAPVYNDQWYTKSTEDDVAFLVRTLDLAPGARILDAGCGTGRHSIALARRGFCMTGVDCSRGMWDQARPMP